MVRGEGFHKRNWRHGEKRLAGLYIVCSCPGVCVCVYCVCVFFFCRVNTCKAHKTLHSHLTGGDIRYDNDNISQRQLSEHAVIVAGRPRNFQVFLSPMIIKTRIYTKMVKSIVHI